MQRSALAKVLEKRQEEDNLIARQAQWRLKHNIPQP
jgi:hypothetical protein